MTLPTVICAQTAGTSGSTVRAVYCYLEGRAPATPDNETHYPTRSRPILQMFLLQLEIFVFTLFLSDERTVHFVPWVGRPSVRESIAHDTL